MFKDGVRRAFGIGERVDVAYFDRYAVAVGVAYRVRIQRIGVVDEEFLIVRKPVIVRVGIAGVGVVEEQFVDCQQPIVVRVLVICIVLGERVEHHRGYVCWDGVCRPPIAPERRAGENVRDGIGVEAREVVSVGKLAICLELDLERERIGGVAIKERVLPRDDERVLRRYRVPHLAWPVGFGEPVPIRLRHDAERGHERSEPVVGSD